MIEAKELRIGNYYIDVCGVPNIWKLEYYQYYQSLPFDYTDGYKKINPIPLTPEILEKCGFRILKKTKFYFVKINDLEISIDPDDGDTFLETYLDQLRLPKKPIKFLHQLQNLYLDLTGEELNIEF